MVRRAVGHPRRPVRVRLDPYTERLAAVIGPVSALRVRVSARGRTPAGCQTCNDLVGWSTTDRGGSPCWRPPARRSLTGTSSARWTGTGPQIIGRRTVSQVLADDLRACWGGRGIYGPSTDMASCPASGTSVAPPRSTVHASGRQLTIDEITFIMRDAGYRFSPGSVEPAIWRVRRARHLQDHTRLDSGQVSGQACRKALATASNAQRAVAHSLRLGRRGPDLWAVLDSSREPGRRAPSPNVDADSMEKRDQFGPFTHQMRRARDGLVARAARAASRGADGACSTPTDRLAHIIRSPAADACDV